MYEKFYGLNESPFNMTPDPKFLYFSDKHSEALTQLLYGINTRKGFLVLTGEIGAGKTTLCRALLNELDENIKSALILNSNLSEIELLQAINEDLGLQYNYPTKKELIDELNQFLLKELEGDGNVVIIIDEAQNLAPSLLEQIRLLSNLETTKEKLLQIILIGQPQLRDVLELPELMQLNQRISIRYHINPLSRKETEDYIYHRLVIAGSKGDIKFPNTALNRIYKFSGGIPRLINVVCDKSLLAGYVLETKEITRQIVEKSISEIDGSSTYKKKKLLLKLDVKAKYIWLVAALIILFIIFVFSNNRFYKSLLNREKSDNSKLSSINIENNEPISKPKILQDTVNLSKNTEIKVPGEKPESSTISTNAVNSKFYFDQNGIMRSSDESFSGITSLSSILRIWNIKADLGSVCMDWSKRVNYFSFWSEAAKYGLQASYIHLDFNRLKALAIPCILQLQDLDNRNLHYSILMSIKKNKVTLGNSTKGLIEITPEELNKIWNGITILIWKNNLSIERELKEGMSGEDVKKAEEVFRSLGYFKGIPPTDYFSPITTTVVKHFQEITGIKIDGIIGPETKIALYTHISNSGYPKIIVE
jgi:general secretion pathway protein A